jgi:Zn-finger nucleic acid-binding protein
MKCLICHMDAIQKIVEGVEIDLCVNCGGVWLDGGELEALTGHNLKDYRQLMCPECNLIMLTRTIGTVEVDHCFKCGGTWLDKGELEAISDLSKGDGGIKEDFNKFSSGVGRTRNVEIAKKSMNKEIELKDGMVDEVFVMYKDGLLITCSTKKVDQEEGVNEDVLAGTLMTIQDFIEVSFGKMGESGLKEIKFGDREILIERGDNIITAVVASGEVPENFNEYVQEVIGKIEERYKASLADWDGNLSNLVGVQEMLTNLLQDSKEDSEPAPAAEDAEPEQQEEVGAEPEPEQQQAEEPEPQQAEAEEPGPQQEEEAESEAEKQPAQEQEPEPQQEEGAEPEQQQAEEPEPEQQAEEDAEPAPEESREPEPEPQQADEQEPEPEPQPAEEPEPNNDPQPWPVDEQ